MTLFRYALPILALGAFAAAPAARAGEFYIGEPVVKEHLQIVPNYLLGIEMNTPAPGMEMGKDAIHLEADVHATAGEPHGLPEDAWIPYLTIHYVLTKDGAKFRKTGVLAPMIAKDGLHYANGVRMDGPGKYHLTYSFAAPALLHHVDKATGVPGWWTTPVTASWAFQYPSKNK